MVRATERDINVRQGLWLQSLGLSCASYVLTMVSFIRTQEDNLFFILCIICTCNSAACNRC